MEFYKDNIYIYEYLVDFILNNMYNNINKPILNNDICNLKY